MQACLVAMIRLDCLFSTLLESHYFYVLTRLALQENYFTEEITNRLCDDLQCKLYAVCFSLNQVNDTKSASAQLPDLPIILKGHALEDGFRLENSIFNQGRYK